MTLTTALASLALAAGAGSSAATTPRPVDSGIKGRVLLGPTCPVERQGHPCVRPYETTLAVYPAGRSDRVATFRSGRDGHFRVALAAGRYRLQATHAGLPRLQPLFVTVLRDRFTSVTVTFDTGIR